MKMPSACAKPETKAASMEASETVKQCIVILEKKIRNLEKRKGKLESYQDRQRGGAELNQDQLEAVSRYDGVIQSLELARELQKNYQTMSSDIEKVSKKLAKREKFERTQRDISRTKEILKLQSLLDSMGDETVRECFKSGSSGAVKLSEEQLEQLDELYKLISPSRDEGDFQEKVKAASEHIVNTLEGSDKAVVGTTYKALKEMVGQIQECGYFEQAASEKAEGSVVPEDSTGEPDVAADDEQDAAEEFSEKPKQQEEMQPAQQPHVAPPPGQQPETAQQPHFRGQEESFFSTVAGFNSQPVAAAPPAPSSQNHARVQRPFQEIVSSVQGNFDFLQDSELDVGGESHPLDPAVVAAHPMVPSGSQNTDLSGTHQAAFQPNLLSSEGAQQSSPFTAAQEPQQPSDSNASQSQLYGQQFDQSGGQQAQQQQQQQQSSSSAAAYSTEQTFSQSLMDNASISFGATSEQSTFMGEQSLGGSIAADGGPQPIPLPNQTLPGQSLSEQSFPVAADSPAFSSEAPVSYSEAAYAAANSSEYGQQQYDGQFPDDGTDKKTFQMNPHASIFRSMYTEQQQQGGSSGGYGNNYNQRQGGGYSSQRSNNGGPRSGNPRGGPRGGSGMNNGYGRGGGPRGASSYGGASNGRSNAPGNGTYLGNNPRGSSRGGAGMRGGPSGGRGGSSSSMRGGGPRTGATSYARSMQQGGMA
jgi:caprin-1